MRLGDWLRGLRRARVPDRAAAIAPPRPRTESGAARDLDRAALVEADSMNTVEAAGLAVHGEAAIAVVVAVTSVDVPWGLLAGPAASVVDLEVRVSRSGGASYQTTVRVGFSTAARRALVAQVGAAVPVRVDPRNPTRVAVDMARLGAVD
ncbi:MAG: hypothetical protein J2P15_14685 [Micromonosporaceae bacterium]|nr:hypothetical protein [Micromonosporaceae bacterium]